MKAAKTQERLAALFGLEAPPPPPSKSVQTEYDTISREAEAVASYWENPKHFIEKMCKSCGNIFAVNRGNISCCSDECRRKWLLDEIGLVWDPKGRTPEERWQRDTGGREPLIVPPEALQILQEVRPQEESVPQSTPTSSQEETDLNLDDLLASIDGL